MYKAELRHLEQKHEGKGKVEPKLKQRMNEVGKRKLTNYSNVKQKQKQDI